MLSGDTWNARRGSTVVYTGTDMRAAVQAAIGSLTAGRTAKERVVVRGSGSISANSLITENPCGVNTTFRNNRLVNSQQNIC
ncbi:hypothetical protein ACFXKG_01755 [Streptomyces sp. NPDC059255]|uniref:hypothetical protein n=1 Tax=Streptomyces sp. NPDC059255 TaxID=3346793 RepID=UPI00367A8EAA